MTEKPICMCRVDVAVAALQGGHHRIVGLVIVGDAIHSKSELWHLYTIIQREICLLHLSVHNHCCHQCDEAKYKLFLCCLCEFVSL